MPIKFPYPEVGWSVGRMRKRGERNGNGNGDDEPQVRQVMDVRRGEPQLEEPGLAEAEKLAGGGVGTRGGTMAQTRADVIRGARGVSPEIIQEHKLQLQRLVADQLNSSTMDFRKINRWAGEKGWNSVLDTAVEADPTSLGKLGREGAAWAYPKAWEKAGDMLIAAGSEKAGQVVKQGGQQLQSLMDEAPAHTQWGKMWWALKESASRGISIKVPYTDPNGQLHEIPLNQVEE